MFSLVFFFCLGLPAFFYSVEARKHFTCGNLKEGYLNARRAKRLNIISIILTFIMLLAGLLVMAHYLYYYLPKTKDFI